MKIAQVEFTRFTLPLTRTLRVGGTELDTRDGGLIRLTTTDGRVGYGEVSPLPGLHRETLDDVEHRLTVGAARLLAPDFADWRAVATTAWATLGVEPTPSLAFGLDAALAGLFVADGEPPATLLGDVRPVPINALFTGTADEAAAQLERLAAYDAIKVKIGREDRADEARMLRTLVDGLPATTRLRLDGNRCLSLDDTVALLMDIPAPRIEYLEEPLQDVSALATLHEQTGIGIALDESLHDEHARHQAAAPHVSAWILKPTLVGPWEHVRAVASHGVMCQKQIVVSSSFESGLGLWSLAQLAASLPGAATAAGLATDAWLAQDLVAPRFDSSAGFVDVRNGQGTPAPEALAPLAFRRLA